MKNEYGQTQEVGLTQLNVRVLAPAKVLIKDTARAVRTPIESVVADALALYMHGGMDYAAKLRRIACQREFKKLAGGKRVSFFDDALALGRCEARDAWRCNSATQRGFS